jgi:CRISPR-associated protein Csd1
MLDLILQQAGISEPGFARKTVKWAITCTEDGRYTGVVALADNKGRSFDACPNLSQPELIGGSQARSHFLVEALPTVALYLDEKLEDKEREKFSAKHGWFVSLLRQAAKDAPYLEAAANLLADTEALVRIQTDLKQAKAKFTEAAVVVVGGINPLERDDWRDWWRGFRAALRPPKTAGGKLMRCILTGEAVDPVATNPKIKGLAGVGGLSMGDVLAGFDKAAFQSYGLEQAANAAMSEATATAYAETLNRLVADKSVKLGNTLATYWFTGQDDIAVADEVMAWFVEPPEQTAGAAERRAHELLNSIRTGQRPDLTGNRFVSLLLSGAAGRVMVREVMQGSFEELVVHTEAWFRDFAIVARDGKGLAHDPKFLAVAGSLVRDLKDLPSPWLQQLWRAAISGGLIPAATLAQAVTRTRIDIIQDTPASHARMALIKAYLIRNRGDNNMKPHMNPDHPHPAYHCGRALALFARLQRAALGDVGAGVVQRYYTAAAQTPGLILGRLASNAKNHLAKLDGGLAWWYENQLAGIMSHIGDFVPRTLTLEEQSLFALGYYQQLAALNAGKQAAPESESTPSN